MPEIHSRRVEVEGLDLHYLECGEGAPVLMIHGWPTHAQLYRHALRAVGETRRAIAIDLPGFGLSAKPVDASYSFRFYDRVLTAFADALGLEDMSLVVHDLGGPVGVHWMLGQLPRTRDLVLLNTLLFPEMSWAAMAFVGASYMPGLRSLLASQWGLKTAMQIGVQDRARHTAELAERYQSPYRDRDARLALLKSAHGLHPKGFHTIGDGVAGLTMPVTCIYGEADRILPDVSKTMARVKGLLPHATLHPIPGCGHFLQEDQPERVAALMADALRD